MDVHFGRWAISAGSALCVARYFGTTPEFRADLEARYDVDVAKQATQTRIDEEVPPRAA
jgi:plasmid maintenance system antidote protein VapI